MQCASAQFLQICMYRKQDNKFPLLRWSLCSLAWEYRLVIAFKKSKNTYSPTKYLSIIQNHASMRNYWPPLRSNGKSYWLQIQRFGFNSRHYQIFWEVVGLEQGPLSLVSTNEELLERKSSGFGLENRDYSRRGSAAVTTRHPSIRKKLLLTSPTSASLGLYSSLAE
jgi:hypothetical protein